MADNDFSMGYAMGQDSGGRNNDGGWGGFGEGLWAVIIVALLFGRGGFGGGLFGGGNDVPPATQADVRAAVDQQTLISKLDQQTYGLADSTYALNNAITSGFYGVDKGLCSLASQMASCCCETQRGIDGINYNMATQLCALGNQMGSNTRDIIDAQNAGTRAILDFLTQDKISTLTAENQALRFAASQTAQNQFITQVGSDIVNRLQPPPVPAYTVPNPFAAYGYNGYGCGCAA